MWWLCQSRGQPQLPKQKNIKSNEGKEKTKTHHTLLLSSLK
jgi:hypothetical protein